MLRTYMIDVVGRGWSITLQRETAREAIRDVWKMTGDPTMKIKVHALSNHWKLLLGTAGIS